MKKSTETQSQNHPPKIISEIIPDFIRADGRCRCSICDREYRLHKSDAQYDFLVRLCDGKLVKL